VKTTLLAIAALTAVAMCLFVAACGGGGDSSSAGPKADAGKNSRLGEARFDMIDDLFAAAVPIDELESNEANAAKLRAAAKPFLDACAALDQDDALLGKLRRGCPRVARLTAQSAGLKDACQDAASCSAAVSDVRTTAASVERFSRSADRVVDATNITSACKDALRTPKKGYAAYDEIDSAFAALQRALKSGSEADLEEAQRRLDAVDRDSPSAKESLEKFRAGCA